VCSPPPPSTEQTVLTAQQTLQWFPLLPNHRHPQSHLSMKLCRLSVRYVVIHLQSLRGRANGSNASTLVLKWHMPRRLRLCQWRRDIQPDRDWQPNSSRTWISFGNFNVAFELSFNCSSDFGRRNLAGNSDKNCLTVPIAFSSFSVPLCIYFYKL
jgi:hypothetical protein